MSGKRIQRGDAVFYPASSKSEVIVRAGPQKMGATIYWEIRLPNGEDVFVPEDALGVPILDETSPVSWLTEHPLVDPDSLARALTHIKLTSDLTDLVYSLGATRTLFRVHQFKPVLKIINSSRQRLLLADEVGLGKTIEAGLVWAEIDARVPTRRVLVLCPSGLQYKWQAEMDRRFDREMQIVNRRDFLKFVDRYSERGDAARFTGICSFGALRSDEVLAALSSNPPSFDLVIVDEAHAMRNPETKTHQLGELITDAASAALLLSATPVNLGSQDLFHLLKLLRPEEFVRRDLFELQLEPNRFINEAARLLAYGSEPGDVLNELEKVLSTAMGVGFQRNPVYNRVVSELGRQAELDIASRVTLEQDVRSLNTISEMYVRTRRRDLPDDITQRKARTVVVELSSQERQIYDLSVEIATDIARSSSGVPAGFARIMPARQASSCLPVMTSYLASVLERRSIDGNLEEGLESDLDSSFAHTQKIGAKDEAIERKILEAIAEANDLDELDSKFDCFVDEIKLLRSEGAGQMLVFSFFRRTIDYLNRRLTDLGYRTASMTGLTPLAGRNRLADEFRQGQFDILLSSEIGAEGLDFEFCDVVVNYDLPWNPMRLEQRIGRLDRFGQEHDAIQIINFEIAGTIDSDIFLRLYERIGVFESSIGELEPILGDRFFEFTRDLASFALTEKEREDRILQLSLAVEKERNELELFEAERARLVGADAHVELAVDEAKASGRYLTPQEIRRYFEGFLREFTPDARILESSEGGLLLSSSPELGEFLRASAEGPLDDHMTLLLQRLETGNSLPIAFSGDDAYGVDNEFLNVRHPLLRSITNAYQGKAALHPSGYVELEMDFDKGDWIFFIVKYEISALDAQRRLQAFAWSSELNEFSFEVGKEILRQLSGFHQRRLGRDDIPILDRRVAAEAYERITGQIDAERLRIQSEVESRNTAQIELQIQSVNLGYEAKENAIRNLLENNPDLDQRIRRMREGELRNAAVRHKQQIVKLEGNRSVAVNLRPVAGGLARVL